MSDERKFSVVGSMEWHVQHGLAHRMWLPDLMMELWDYGTVDLVNVSGHLEGTLKAFNLFLCLLITSTLSRLL